MGWAILWVSAVIVAVMVGGKKGRTTEAVLLGLFLSWVGVIIVAVMPEKTVKKVDEKTEMKICPHCGWNTAADEPKCSNCGKVVADETQG